MILQWDKPKKARSTEEHNAAHQSDTGVPGTYVPNMSDEDNKAWKAKKIGDRVEIRKLFTDLENWAQVLIKVYGDGFEMSANGRFGLTWETFYEMQDAINEARAVLEESASVFTLELHFSDGREPLEIEYGDYPGAREMLRQLKGHRAARARLRHPDVAQEAGEETE
mgnify:CR=1 FL=1